MNEKNKINPARIEENTRWEHATQLIRDKAVSEYNYALTNLEDLYNDEYCRGVYVGMKGVLESLFGADNLKKSRNK